MSRFNRLARKIENEGESAHEAKAVAAIAGRKKYGKTRFGYMAADGKAKKRDIEIGASQEMGQGLMLSKYSDEDVVNIVNQLVAEAILEGRLDNVEQKEIDEATDVGLSLGFVQQTADGGLELGLKTGAVGMAKRRARIFLDAIGPKFGGSTSPLRKGRRALQDQMYAAAADKSFIGRAKTLGRGIVNKVKQNPKQVKFGATVAGAGAVGGYIGSRRKQPLE